MRELKAKQLYDGLAESYDVAHVDSKSLAENRVITRRLRALIGPRDRVADLGCGTGLLLELLDIGPERYVGLDISEGMLRRARTKFPKHEFQEGNIEGPMPGIASASVDVAVSLFGSPSYCDVEKIAKQVRRILRPGGRFFFMYCGPRYSQRKTYVGSANDGMLHKYSSKQLRSAFGATEVRGMCRVVDSLPTWTPLLFMEPLLCAEAAILGRLLPDACYFLNVAGQLKDQGQAGAK